MAVDSFITNAIPTGYGNFLVACVGMWTGAGWTVKGSGDGLTSFSTTGNIFTGGGSGAGGMGNSGGWIRMQDPGGLREFTWQWNNAGGLRWFYSPVQKFIGGSPSATRVPSATDGYIIGGAGTDASPLYYTNLLPGGLTTTTAKIQGGAKSSSPYGWWISAGTNGGANSLLELFMDPVIGDAFDNDQMLIGCSNNSLSYTVSSLFTINVPAQNAAGHWAFIDTTLLNLTGFTALGYVGNNSINGSGGSINPFSSKYDLKPILWERGSTNSGVCGQKGYSTNFRWTSVAKSNFTDTADNKNWICLGSCWAFWDGITVPTQ